MPLPIEMFQKSVPRSKRDGWIHECISGSSTMWDCLSLIARVDACTCANVQIVKMCKLCRRIILCEAAKVKFQSVALHDDATLRIDKWWGGPGPTRHNEKCTIWEDCALHVLRIYVLHNRAALCAIRAAQCQHLSRIMRMHNGSEVDNVSSVLGLNCLRPAMILNSNTPLPSPHVDWYLTPTDGFQPPLILKPSSPNNLNNTLIQPQFYTKYQNGWYLNL